MKRHLLFILILVVIALALGALPNIWSKTGPVWKDSAAVACAVKHISQNHALGWGENFYITFDSPDVPYCWNQNQYPLIQVIIYAFKLIFNISPGLATTIVYLGAYLLVVLAIYLVSFEIHQKKLFALISGFLAATSLALLRILVISPHQLFGFLLIILIAWFLIRFEKKKQKLYIGLILISLIALVFLHQFSLAVISLPLLIYLLAKIRKKIYILPIIAIVIGLVILAAYFISGWTNPISYILGVIYNASTLGMANLLPAHAIWDHAAILGYALTILGVFGAFWCLFIKKFPLKAFWWSLIIICLLAAHSYIFGFYLIGYRFVFFLFIPLAILAPLLLKLFSKNKIILGLIVAFIIIASGLHSLNFLLDNYNGLVKNVLPTVELKQALKWLNENSSNTDTVLMTMRENKKYAPFLPYYFRGNVMSYPVFIFTNLKDFNFKSKTYKGEYPQTKLAKLIEPYADLEKIEKSRQKDILELEQMHQVLNWPGDKESKKIEKQYNIRYVIAWKGEIENKIFSKSKTFETVFENDLLVIYKNKKLQ